MDRPPVGISASAHRSPPSFTGWLTRSRSRRQRLAGLLRHHVLGIPGRPILIAPAAHARLVLAVGDRRAPHRARQIRCGGEVRRVRVDALALAPPSYRRATLPRMGAAPFQTPLWRWLCTLLTSSAP